jgi:hypothetical protein
MSRGRRNTKLYKKALKVGNPILLAINKRSNGGVSISNRSSIISSLIILSPKISYLIKPNERRAKPPTVVDKINQRIRIIEQSALAELDKGLKSVSEYLKKSSDEKIFYVLRAIIYKGLCEEYYGLFVMYSKRCKRIQDDENRNLLILAAIYGCAKLVAFLVTKIKMNLYKKKKGGLTAYDCAVKEREEKIALYLGDFMGLNQNNK